MRRLIRAILAAMAALWMPTAYDGWGREKENDNGN